MGKNQSYLYNEVICELWRRAVIKDTTKNEVFH